MGHLHANLEALAGRDLSLAKRLCLSVASDQVRLGADGGLERVHRRAWLPLSLPPEAVAAFVGEAARPEQVIAFGLGDGAQVMAWLDARPDRPLVVWERDPWLVRLFLDRFALGPALATGRLRLALACDLVELAATPGVRFVPHPVARAQYAPEWRLVEAGPAATGPIALVATGELFVDDLEDALGAEGYRVYPLDASLHAIEELGYEVIRLRPALVATINYRNGLAEFCERFGVPMISWEIDPATDRLAPLESPASRARVFTYRAAQVEEFRRAGFPHVEYLPLATNPSQRRAPAPQPDDDRYRAAVSFVGASMVKQAAAHRARLLALLAARPGAPSWAELEAGLDALLAEQARDYSRYVISERFAALLGSTASTGEDPVQLAGEIAAAGKRLDYLAALAPLGVEVWGDEGFAPLAASGARVRGPAGHRHELNRIYAGSLVNVDIGRVYQGDIVTMRVFDAMACGGLVLTEWSEALASLFDIGREVAVYRTRDELCAQVRHLAANPDEAREIAARGRARVLRDHTIRGRVQHMLGTLPAR